jgi:hypothetical protein
VVQEFRKGSGSRRWSTESSLTTVAAVRSAGRRDQNRRLPGGRRAASASAPAAHLHVRAAAEIAPAEASVVAVWAQRRYPSDSRCRRRRRGGRASCAAGSPRAATGLKR